MPLCYGACGTVASIHSRFTALFLAAYRVRKEFCVDNFLSIQTLEMIDDLRRQVGPSLLPVPPLPPQPPASSPRTSLRAASQSNIHIYCPISSRSSGSSWWRSASRRGAHRRLRRSCTRWTWRCCSACSPVASTRKSVRPYILSIYRERNVRILCCPVSIVIASWTEWREIAFFSRVV